jgi:hypothetical protein
MTKRGDRKEDVKRIEERNKGRRRVKKGDEMRG